MTDLLERVKAASGPDRELDGEVHDFATQTVEQYAPAYTASVDAALALVERLLPGWNWHLNRLGQPRAVINDGPKAQFECWDNTTLPLAILAALLTALQAAPAALENTDDDK